MSLSIDILAWRSAKCSAPPQEVADDFQAITEQIARSPASSRSVPAMSLAGAKFPGAGSMGRKRNSTKEPTVEQQRGNREFWPEVTNPKGYRYYFHPKHHRASNATGSRWKPDVSRQEEFTIFEVAVHLDLADEDGDLYNVRKSEDGAILELGVFQEQIAQPLEAERSNRCVARPSALAGRGGRPEKSRQASKSSWQGGVPQASRTRRAQCMQSHRSNNGKHA